MNRRLYVMKKKVVAMLLAGIMAAGALAGCGGSSDVGRILRTFKIKKNVEVTDNGKIII